MSLNNLSWCIIKNATLKIKTKNFCYIAHWCRSTENMWKWHTKAKLWENLSSVLFIKDTVVSSSLPIFLSLLWNAVTVQEIYSLRLESRGLVYKSCSTQKKWHKQFSTLTFGWAKSEMNVVMCSLPCTFLRFCTTLGGDAVKSQTVGIISHCAHARAASSTLIVMY